MLILLLCVSFLGQTSAVPAKAELVKPASVRKIYGDGRHNMCPFLVRWKGDYWLAFRNATNHRSQDGDHIIMKSPDGVKWKQAFRFDDGPDDRDPQFLATRDRLFLYDPVSAGGNKARTLAKYTDDGLTWTKAKEIYKAQYVLWRPFESGGKFFAAGFKGRVPGKERHAELITSTDGLDWTTVSTIRAGQSESEPTVHILPDGKGITFLRDVARGLGVVLTSEPPFKTWKQGEYTIYLAGQSAYTFKGVNYLISRTVEKTAKGEISSVTVFTFDTNGKLQPYCTLPSGGDCAYGTAVKDGNDMMIAYYSSHEGSTNIYLARVPLRKS